MATKIDLSGIKPTDLQNLAEVIALISSGEWGWGYGTDLESDIETARLFTSFEGKRKEFLIDAKTWGVISKVIDYNPETTDL